MDDSPRPIWVRIVDRKTGETALVSGLRFKAVPRDLPPMPAWEPIPGEPIVVDGTRNHAVDIIIAAMTQPDPIPDLDRLCLRDYGHGSYAIQRDLALWESHRVVILDHPDASGGDFLNAGRLTWASVEGGTSEMVAICEAILADESIAFDRCAVEALPGDRFAFWSPRNSLYCSIWPGDECRRFAAEALETL